MIPRVWQGVILAVILVLLAVAAAAPGLGNGYVLDDIFIVRDNPRVHNLLAPWTYAAESYWKSSYCCAMYRPFTIWAFAVEWRAGGGAPLLFHAVNLSLYVLTTLGVFWLLRRLVAPLAAWFGAAIFAVHPIHVEATGNVVGQAELWVGLAAVVAVAVYLRARQLGAIPVPTQLGLIALIVVGSLAKEQGFVIPLLLLAAEATVIDDRTPWRRRFEEHRVLVLGSALALAVILFARFAVLNGLGGGPPFVVFREVPIGNRLLIMLGIVPEWTRLFFWPARLRADYGPPAHGMMDGVGVEHALGLLIVAAAALAVIASRRRSGVVAFGVLTAVVALLPASNLLFPTGVLLAERTLYLPSLGVAIAAAAAASEFAASERVRGSMRLLAGIGAGLVMGLGVVRSAQRQTIWRDNETLFAATLRDAPDNYRSYSYYARHLVTEGRPEAAIPYLSRAVSLYPADARVAEDLAQLLRQSGRCAEALEILEDVLERDATRMPARAKAINCLFETGDFVRARELAAEGVARGDTGFEPLRARADSLLRATSRD